jgi:tetratricopeptide (TPR) repeat protein
VIRSVGPRIFLLENHDEAYYLWKDSGMSETTVVHIDAHHDLYETEGTKVPCISDYLRYALREGVAGRVYWVVPSPAWDSEAGRRSILGHLKALAKSSGGGQYTFDEASRVGKVTLYGREVTACSIEGFETPERPFVLDIDVDYMLMEDAPVGALHRVPERPWTSPGKLASQLAHLAGQAEMITICYSVLGGFTPLSWKHLGDDLASILSSEDPDEASAYCELKMRMAEALLDSNLERHIELREAAERQNPDDASLHHWRALAHLRAGDRLCAQQAHARAIELDPTYAHSFAFGGLIFEAFRDFEAAREAYEKTVALNETDALGWFGLGRIALRKGDRPRARECLDRAISHADAPAEAYRELGALWETEGDRENALGYYRAYLRSAFDGRSLEGPIGSVRDRAYRSPFWSEGYAALARGYTTAGSNRLSANCYSQALRLTNPRIYEAARPIFCKMAGDGVPVLQLAGSSVKSLAIAVGIGLARGYAMLRWKARAPAGPMIRRLCPPVRVRPRMHAGS